MSGVIMTGRRRVVVVLAAVAALAVAAAVALVGLRGNGSEVAATPTVSLTRTSSAAPSQSPTLTATPRVTSTAPVLPAAAAERDQKGAEAFFRYFLEVYVYTYNTFDSAPLRAASVRECRFCSGVIANVAKAQEAGQSVDAPPLVVDSLLVSPGDAAQGLLVVAQVDQGPVVTRGADGAEVARTEGVKSARLDARVIFTDSGWSVRAVSVKGGDKK